MRRITLVFIAVALAITALAAAARWRATRDVHGSTSVEFVPPKAQPSKAQPSKQRTSAPTAWVTYGFDAARRRVSPSLLRPPFRREWIFRARRLLEFPPAVSDGRIYLPVFDGRLYALDARSGRVLWRRHSERCIWSTPALERGLLIQTYINRSGSCNERTERPGGGSLIAFRARDGAIRWRHTIPPTESSPLVVGQAVYIGDWDGWLRSYDLESGRLLWRRELGGAIKGSVAYADGRLYVGAYDGRLYCFDRSGRQLWRSSAQPSFSGAVGNFYSTPAVAYGRVYLGSTGGKIYSFGALSGKLRWSHSTGGYVYASPAVWNGLVFIGSYDRYFYALDAATGAVRWRFHANGPVSGAATVLDGLVYFSTLAGRTYALDAVGGRSVWSAEDGQYSPVVDDGARLYLVGYGSLYALRPVKRSSVVSRPRSGSARSSTRARVPVTKVR